MTMSDAEFVAFVEGTTGVLVFVAFVAAFQLGMRYTARKLAR